MSYVDWTIILLDLHYSLCLKKYGRIFNACGEVFLKKWKYQTNGRNACKDVCKMYATFGNSSRWKSESVRWYELNNVVCVIYM